MGFAKRVRTSMTPLYRTACTMGFAREGPALVGLFLTSSAPPFGFRSHLAADLPADVLPSFGTPPCLTARSMGLLIRIGHVSAGCYASAGDTLC